MTEDLKSAYEEIKICSNTAIIWHFKLVPVWVEICKHIHGTLFLEFSRGLYFYFLTGAKNKRLSFFRKKRQTIIAELNVWHRPFAQANEARGGKGNDVAIRLSVAAIKVLIQFPQLGSWKGFMDWPSKISNYGQGGILIKADRCLLPHISPPAAFRRTFSMGKPARCILADEKGFFSVFFKSAWSSLTPAMWERPSYKIWKVGCRQAKESQALWKRSKRQNKSLVQRKVGALSFGLPHLGLLFPQVRLSEGVCTFQKSSMTLSRWLLNTGTPDCGISAGGFYAILFGCWNINPTWIVP